MNKITALFFVGLMLFFASCSKPETRKSQSVLDSPENHISMGMKMFDSGDYEKAKFEFDDAIKIKANDKEHAGAYAGLGMYFAIKGDEEKAEKNAKKAIELNDKLPLGYISFGRTIGYLNAGKDSEDWLDDAIVKFDRAIKLADEQRDIKAQSKAYYFKGIVAKQGYAFGRAKDAFTKVIELNSEYQTEANKEWEKVQMIERAKPGTKAGKKVALMDEIGRGEIAVLFVEELKINEVLAKKEKKEYDTGYKAPTDPMKYEADKLVKADAVTDIDNSWAKSWINQVIENGVMEVGPDHKFNPNEKITRAEFAQMLLRVLVIISNDESLYTKYFGEESSMFPDVRTDHFAYNAIAVCATRGIMKAEMNGEFGIAKKVSGAEALLTIRELQNSLRLTF
ncbi:MAG: S-layer homology domain-containing protein [Candidatus Delongbacteria bacterium]|nr:S-layer homology domain-containing protein [Candidatus Delongbacteria bacterium]MBN2833776.1 S-layer homology domain-containing protein [Candidatus Delongbacteria bacterium]